MYTTTRTETIIHSRVQDLEPIVKVFLNRIKCLFKKHNSTFRSKSFQVRYLPNTSRQVVINFKAVEDKRIPDQGAMRNWQPQLADLSRGIKSVIWEVTNMLVNQADGF